MEWAKTDPQDSVVISTLTSLIWMRREDETDFTAGVNSCGTVLSWPHLRAYCKIDSFNTADLSLTATMIIAGSPIRQLRYPYAAVIHASYLFPNVMNMKNFNIYSWGLRAPIEAPTQANSATARKTPAMAAGCAFKYFF
ncbi:carbohydrate porin [Klebsiella pneumoniae subsp. pneumoniae]|nr:carbohydrate porin [Klebsiella pneumoniae subsp. pneumoniae]